MLTDIANYIQRKKQVSLSELSVVFGVTKEVIEPMLQHYVAKGWLLLHHGNPVLDARPIALVVRCLWVRMV